MKKIGIDARLLFQTGVGTYLQNLLHFLPQFTSSNNSYYIYCLPKDVDAILSYSSRYIPRPSPFLWHTVSEQIGFLAALQKDSLDLMHFTYFGHPVAYLRPFVSTIHDITPLMYRTGRSSTNCVSYWVKKAIFRYVFQNQLIKSKAIITPTHTVKEQLIRLYGDRWGAKIMHINEGISYRHLKESQDREKNKGDYYLYVGNVYPHKNVQALIQAFLKSGSQKKLIIAGPSDYFTHALQSTLPASATKQVQFKINISLKELQTLYAGATALIHPSLSEGFGLPILEAANYSLPIIASGIPVFREILGTSYYSFDPYDIQSIVHAIHTFEDSVIKKCPVLRQKYSFRHMAEQTHKLYEKYI